MFVTTSILFKLQLYTIYYMVYYMYVSVINVNWRVIK